MNKKVKKVMEKIKSVVEKINKVCLAIMVAVYTMIFNTQPIFAADFGSSIFAIGTKNLLTDIGKYLLIIAPIAGTVVGVYFFIRRGAADEMDQKKWNDRIKTTIISTIGAVLVSALIILIASYYGKTVNTGI